MKMLLPSILIFAIIGIGIQGNAQEVQLGFKAGFNKANVNLAGVSSDFIPKTKGINRFNIGVVAEIAITDQFSIQPELNHMRKGFKISEGIDLPLFGLNVPLGVAAKADVSFLEMPILAKYNFGENRTSYYVSAGPVFGYALKGKIKTVAQVIVDIPLTSTDINFDSENINRFELSGRIAAGMKVKNNNGHFFMEANYTHGFTKMDNISIVDLKLTNRNVGLNIGYMFSLNGNGPRA